MFTPERIEKLSQNEVIVVGTNLAGSHGGGAARQAYEDFGLKWGFAEGLSGKTYAFPTLDTAFQQASIEQLSKSRNALFECAEEHHELTFFLTKIGCGIAGYSENEIKPLFGKNTPKNIILPESWDVRYEENNDKGV